MSAKVMTAAMAALLAGAVLADAGDFTIVKAGRARRLSFRTDWTGGPPKGWRTTL